MTLNITALASYLSVYARQRRGGMGDERCWLLGVSIIGCCNTDLIKEKLKDSLMEISLRKNTTINNVVTDLRIWLYECLLESCEQLT